MPSHDYDKVIELLRLLLSRSRAGQVKWETYPDEEMVRTDVGPRTVRIGKETGSFRGDDGSRFENQPCFVVWVMDEYGRSLDEFMILPIQPGDFEMVDELFRIARSSARQTSEVLDEMIAALRK